MCNSYYWIYRYIFFSSKKQIYLLTRYIYIIVNTWALVAFLLLLFPPLRDHHHDGGEDAAGSLGNPWLDGPLGDR